MRKTIIILLVLSLLLVVACEEEKPDEPITQIDCTVDSHCGVGGCSSQVCDTADRAKEIITTCEMKPEYECLSLTSCGCVEGKCMWEDNDEFKDCMTQFS